MTDQPEPQQPPTGDTKDQQTVHRTLPSIAEHNAWMHEHRPDDCIGQPPADPRD